MSASREKRTRQDQTAQGLSEARFQKQAEEKKEQSRRLIYIVIGAACAVCALALLIWNSDLFRNHAAAVTINGEKYTAADVQYYYNNVRQYYAMYGGYDYSASARDQIYDEASNQTWHDYFLEQAVDALAQNVALEGAAEQEGYMMSEEAAGNLQSALDSLETAWITSGYGSRDAYLRAAYGSGMSYNRYKTNLIRAILASDYASDKQSSFTYTKEELNAYYEENKDNLDTYVFNQFLFMASATEAVEADGDAEAAKAVTLDEAREAARAKAEELQAKLEAGEDPEKLSEEYAGDAFAYLNEEHTGSSLSYLSFADWLSDSGRKTGDVTVSEYDGGSYSYYYVVQFQNRYQNTGLTAGVRHILVSAGNLSDGPDEEAFAQAEAAAEELLEQWKVNGGTEEAFAALAEENSADTGSAANGGLIANVSSSSGYVSTFRDWALDPSRKSGDTGIVRNDGSSIVGYHVMYFVDWAEPEWQLSAEQLKRAADLTAWQEELENGYTVENGSGLKYVG